MSLEPRHPSVADAIRPELPELPRFELPALPLFDRLSGHAPIATTPVSLAAPQPAAPKAPRMLAPAPATTHTPPPATSLGGMHGIDPAIAEAAADPKPWYPAQAPGSTPPIESPFVGVAPSIFTDPAAVPEQPVPAPEVTEHLELSAFERPMELASRATPPRRRRLMTTAVVIAIPGTLVALRWNEVEAFARMIAASI